MKAIHRLFPMNDCKVQILKFPFKFVMMLLDRNSKAIQNDDAKLSEYIMRSYISCTGIICY